MRLDLFLKASRLCPRRSVAQELCDAGAVIINGNRAKAARAVNPGDLITIERRDRVLTVRVESVPQTKQVARAEASSLYAVVEDRKTGDFPA
jgi:ribosomal 50S subunit-recycling heat shock protein